MIHSFVHGLHTYCSAWVDSAFHPLTTGTILLVEYCNANGSGECSVYSSLQADSKVKFAAWHTNWRPPDADRLSVREPEWTLVYGFVPWMKALQYLPGIIILLLFLLKARMALQFQPHFQFTCWSSTMTMCLLIYSWCTEYGTFSCIVSDGF